MKRRVAKFFLLLLSVFLLIPTLGPGPQEAMALKRYLPLIAQPAPETRLVVFEGFYNPT